MGAPCRRPRRPQADRFGDTAASTRHLRSLLEDRGYAFSALALAAPAKLPGASPIALLERARLNAIALPADDFDALRWDAGGARRAAGLIKLEFADRVRKAIEELAAMPPAAAPGFLYLDRTSGFPVAPVAETLPVLEIRPASRRGALPRLSPP